MFLTDWSDVEEDAIAWVGKPDDCHVNCDLILDGDVSDNIISDQIMILVTPCNVNIGISTHPDRMDRKTPPTPL